MPNNEKNRKKFESITTFIGVMRELDPKSCWDNETVFTGYARQFFINGDYSEYAGGDSDLFPVETKWPTRRKKFEARYAEN